MAKSPNKRRGITLGARAESADALRLLSPGLPACDSPDSAGTGPVGASAGTDIGTDPSGGPQTLPSADTDPIEPDLGWRLQAERLQGQLERQLRQLEEQGEAIAAQNRQLSALERGRRASGRLGVLLALLALSTTAALGFHTWPALQDLSGNLGRLSADLRPLAPQVQTVRAQVGTLTADLGQTGSAVESLRQDVSGVRTELGAVRQSVAAAPAVKGPAQASARPGSGQATAQPAVAWGNPYRTMRPPMPW